MSKTFFPPQRFFLSFAACSGLAAVLFGAFAAHGLQRILPSESLKIFETGVRYQMYHTLALLFLSLKDDGTSGHQKTGWLFIAGILLFSGSLYALVFSGLRFWGWLTPAGGLLFLMGWLALFVESLKQNGSQNKSRTKSFRP